MPTYDYECQSCGHTFELFQSMSAPVKRKCPQCGKNKLERLIGKGAAVLFKGSGFYETDYRKDSYTKDAKADKPESDGKSEKNEPSKTGPSKTGPSKTGPEKSEKPASSGTKKKAGKPAKKKTD